MMPYDLTSASDRACLMADVAGLAFGVHQQPMQAAFRRAIREGYVLGLPLKDDDVVTVRLRWEGPRLFAGDVFLLEVDQSPSGGFYGSEFNMIDRVDGPFAIGDFKTAAEARTALMAAAKEALGG